MNYLPSKKIFISLILVIILVGGVFWISERGKREGGLASLDKNENIIPMSNKIIAQLRRQLTADMLSAYPETTPLYEQIAQLVKAKRNNIYLSSGSDGAIKS